MPVANSLTITNVRLIGQEGLYRITIAANRIAAIDSMRSPRVSIATAQSIDAAGDFVTQGGIDLQINGALGLAFPTVRSSDRDKLDKICQFLWDQGVDGFLPTIVTTSIENIERSLSVFADYQSKSANLLGVHLEGPFLNPAKRGAHPQEHLLPLSIEQVKRVLGDYASIVKVITLAPELDPSGEAIEYLRSLDIIVSLGHSLATAEQAQRAIAQGATMVTHAFNAMPPLHHREPGMLAAALLSDRVHCGFIADGQHIHPLMLKLLLRSGNPLFLVSDALAPLGLGDGRYPWDTREIDVVNGTARLLDGTLSGTTLPLLAGVQNLVAWEICEVEEAIALATIAPRQAIGLPGLKVGQPASLLRWRFDTTLEWQRIVLG
ncbi:N-acetylglucosamine-6-phosphate deacetylase [Microcoleus sp. FACHB-1515]|uniref:N-acetylglucosamine-6-phosphate deacetylase n=1 Tax=Cyanophyceae TaxID=3028117 RepID=UPI001687CCEC|nr:N-acetylglucosamine-6-phosphate deacetylase [Microcoleus sp. FACHB-1515]MBD2090531.1 N-acetylglucosamine-6-phosphate deacetylase [Microcoleus sp. FACHB-1515]